MRQSFGKTITKLFSQLKKLDGNGAQFSRGENKEAETERPPEGGLSEPDKRSLSGSVRRPRRSWYPAFWRDSIYANRARSV